MTIRVHLLPYAPSKEEKEAGELPIVKICDFGVSQIIKDNNKKTVLSTEDIVAIIQFMLNLSWTV